MVWYRMLAVSFTALLFILPIAIAVAVERPAATATAFIPLASRAQMPIGIIVSPGELSVTRTLAVQGFEPSQRAVKSLLKDADNALTLVPCAPSVYTDADFACLNDMSEASYVLALAYCLTGDGRYGAQAARIIRAWSETLTGIDPSDDQPQLDWSRAAPAMIWGADLLDGSQHWSPDDRARFRSMLVNIVLPKGREAARRWNNWADAGNVLRLTIAVYAQLPDERAAAIASWKQKLDGERQPDGSWKYGMLPNGSLTEENRRSEDGLAYNQGALSMKTVFADILRRQYDASLFSYRTPRGASLKDGWDFLAPQVVAAAAQQCIWPYTPDHCVDYSNRSGWEIAYAYWRDPAYLGPLMLHRPYQWSNWSDPGYSTVLYARP